VEPEPDVAAEPVAGERRGNGPLPRRNTRGTKATGRAEGTPRAGVRETEGSGEGAGWRPDEEEHLRD